MAQRNIWWPVRAITALLLCVALVFSAAPHTDEIPNNIENKELIIKPNYDFTGTMYGQMDSIMSTADYSRIEDFHITNLILTSDVEGNLNAVNRVTGELLWSLVGGQPLVNIQSNEKKAAKYIHTTPIPMSSESANQQNILSGNLRYSNPHQKLSNTETRKHSTQKMDRWKDGITWIVEPYGDGTVYQFTGRGGIEKLQLSIKELVLNSPFSIDDRFVYTGTRTSGIVKINARSGAIVESFGLDSVGVCSADPTDFISELNLHPDNNFEEFYDGFDDSTDYFSSHSDNNINDEEGPFIILGKTIYELTIHSKNHTSWNITYIQWGPNNLHSGLTQQNIESPDDIYIQPFHDSSLLALDVNTKLVKWVSNLPSVTVGIFDVFVNAANDEEYIILPHPLNGQGAVSSSNSESTYLDRTKEGSWYALSEHNYPSLVRSAPLAKYITNERWRVPAVFANDDLLEIAILGVHNGDFKSQESLQNRDISNNKLAIYHSSTSTNVPKKHEHKSMKSHKHEKNNDILNYEEFLKRNNDLPTITFKGASISQLLIRAFENVIVALICLIVFFVLSKIGLFEYFTAKAPARSVKVGGKFDDEILSQKEEQVMPNNTGSNTKSIDALPLSNSETAEVPTDTINNENKEEDTEDVKRKRKRGTRGGKRGKKRDYQETEPSKVVSSVNNSIIEDDELHDTTDVDILRRQRGDALIVSDNNEHITKISYSLSITDIILGFGSHGTMVFKGYFENRPVAVKRMLLDFYDVASHEINLLQESDDHSNVVRYFCSQVHNKFLYIALELCSASLEDVVEKKKDLGVGIEPSKILYQIANGVYHLHSLKIVHRDIKPQNILVTTSTKIIKNADKKNETETTVRFLISDFGLCKKLDTDQSSFKGTTANAAGTSGWRAPELLLDTSPAYITSTMKNKVRLTRSLDVFSAGCVFFYVLTGGYHPFGDRYIREGNIIKDDYDLSMLNDLRDSFIIKDLIISMIQRNPLLRPDISVVMKHPYFWSTDKKLEFLLKVSDRFEVEKRDPPSELLIKFESIADDVLGAKGWFQKFDDNFIDNLGKYRKYNTHKLMDLLRAIRNKYHHYQDLPKDLAAEIGSLPDGFYWYFAHKFPRLLLCVFKLTQQILHDDDLLSPYF